MSSKAGWVYTYGDPAHKHAVTALSTGNTYVYDPNGNMITRTVNQQTYQYGYDPENRLTSVSGAAQAQFTYTDVMGSQGAKRWQQERWVNQSSITF